jgi:glutathione peroxidase
MGCAFFKSGSDKIKPEEIDFFSFKINNISGKLIDFTIFKGKKAFMIVNVACK